MVLRSKQDYLEFIRTRYRRAGKKAKTIILDEFCATCGYNRKYAIRMLSPTRKKAATGSGSRPGPKTIYRAEKLVEALKRIWFASDQMCSKKLKAAIPLWLPFYDAEFEFLEETTKEKLLRVSSATIDRLIKPFRALHKKGRCTTRPGTLLKNQIPVKTEHWDVSQPGFFEADTVAHCGNSMAGDFVFSLTFTDILTGWTENRAVWGKGSQEVLRQIEDIEHGITFPILGFDCDNGSEFLNHHLVRYFTDRPKNPVMFTRSRPFQKNDNAFVEQKNWTQVRQTGTGRPHQRPLQDRMELLQQLLLPNTKAQRKDENQLSIRQNL
jgi:ribosomal protein L37E